MNTEIADSTENITEDPVNLLEQKSEVQTETPESVSPGEKKTDSGNNTLVKQPSKKNDADKSQQPTIPPVTQVVTEQSVESNVPYIGAKTLSDLIIWARHYDVTLDDDKELDYVSLYNEVMQKSGNPELANLAPETGLSILSKLYQSKAVGKQGVINPDHREAMINKLATLHQVPLK
jgi:hypothetical protein